MKAGAIVNLVLVIALSAGLTVGSFTAFPAANVLSLDEADLQAQLDSTGTVQLNGRDSVSLLEGGTADWNWSADDKKLEATLTSGTLFFAT